MACDKGVGSFIISVVIGSVLSSIYEPFVSSYDLVFESISSTKWTLFFAGENFESLAYVALEKPDFDESNFLGNL